MDGNVRWITAAEVFALGSALQVATVTLNDAQIKALPDSPIVIIPPTEVLNYSGFPSKFFVLVRAYGVLDTTAGAYTIGDGSGNLTLLVGTDGSSGNFNVGIAGASTSYNSPMQFNPWTLGDLQFDNAGQSSFGFVVGQANVLQNASIYDNAIVIQAVGANPITDGDPIEHA